MDVHVHGMTISHILVKPCTSTFMNRLIPLIRSGGTREPSILYPLFTTFRNSCNAAKFKTNSHNTQYQRRMEDLLPKKKNKHAETEISTTL